MVEDVAPQQAWQALAADPQAQLVDVRTDAEWTYVGLPELAELNKRVLLIAWQAFPTGEVNRQFLQQLAGSGLQPTHDIYFICRSGARSLSAEGPPDDQGHRGGVAGWKASALPWRQR